MLPATAFSLDGQLRRKVTKSFLPCLKLAQTDRAARPTLIEWMLRHEMQALEH